jgi:hypothetical protein
MLIIKRLAIKTSARTYLIGADQVSRRVAERRGPACAARAIRVHSFDNYSTVGRRLRQGTIDAVDPNVGQQAEVTRRVSIRNPSAADVSRGIIEAWSSGVPVSDVPAEYFFVEGN